MKKIIKNGIVVTMNAAGDVWDHGYVMFEDTKILAAGPEDELEKTLQELTAQGILKAGETFEEIDAKRAIVIPGLVNTHCHLGMIPFRGLGDDCKDRLRVFLLPMENQAMDAEMAKLSTRYAIGELLVKATPLLIIALGLAVCFRSNVWNIGAEGQFVMGAIAVGTVAGSVRTQSGTPSRVMAVASARPTP